MKKTDTSTSRTQKRKSLKPFPYYQRIRFFWGNYQKDFPCLLYLGTTETAMVLTDSTDHGNGPLAVAVWKDPYHLERECF